MNNAILLRGVTRRFGETIAVNKVSLALPSKGIIGLLGSSGSGKSTLLHILSGVDSEYEGMVKVLGVDLTQCNDARKRRLRLRKIGCVFQNFHLLELETAEMNVLSIIDACYRGKKSDKRRKALDLLSFFGVEKKAKQKVNTLSGGEKQRVALARALACDPKIILADEPTGALDEKRAQEVFALLRRCSKDRLVIVVSHDEALSRQFCDVILTMKDGSIIQKEVLHHEAKETSPHGFHLREKKRTPKLSLGFLLRHAFHVMRAKKWRSLLSSAVISMGLTGLGLSSYISDSIGAEIHNAFSSVVPPSTLIMSPRGGNDSPLGSVYAARFEECEYAVEEYGDMVMDYGSDIHLDYESWFCDHNEFFVKSGLTPTRLRDFSARHINDFQWLDLHPELHCYPRRPAMLSVDQVVLGLPYQNMFTTCLDLRILRDYQTLGDHIDAHGMYLYLDVANEEFGFDDEEIFEVVAVVQSDVPCFYHLDHRWNRHVFIDQMKFRSSLTEINPTPQYVLEVPYLQLLVPASEFLYQARRDENLSHWVCDPDSPSYHPTVCPAREACGLNRLYLYGADKTGVAFEAMDRCCELCPEILGRQPATEGSYYAASDSLAKGFAGKFYLCSSFASAEEVADAYSDLPIDEAFLPGNAIEGTVDGSYFATGGDGVRIASPPRGYEKPKSCEECYLSKSLYERWGSPKEIYVAAEIYGEQIGDDYVREIAIASMQVLGAIEDDHQSFYVADDWTVDFYLECLGVSSFVLEPYAVTFHLEEGCDVSGVIRKLESEFPDYSFSNPSEDIASSVTSVLGYVGKILTVFSFVSLGMSALLFLIVMTITVNERMAEASMLSYIGIRKADVIRVFSAHAVLYAFSATVSAIAAIALTQLVVKFYIADAFGSAVRGGLSWEPFAVVGVAAMAFTVSIMLGISLNLRIKMGRNALFVS